MTGEAAPGTRRLKLAPSILTADFAHLADEVAVVAPYVDWLHLDVMDGHYARNLTFGPAVVAALRRTCTLPMHVHMQLTDPGFFVQMFADAGAHRISFHPETTDDPAAVIAQIKALGCGAGLAVHPKADLADVQRYLRELDVILIMTVEPGFGGQSFMGEVVTKIADAKRMLDEYGSSADLEVDGGIKPSLLAEVAHAGANTIVVGSALFDGVDPARAARLLRTALDELESSGS